MDILTNVKNDDYWKQRGYAINEYIEEHADVPSLYLGGWYDTYPRNTIQNFLDFSATKDSDQRLLMGPWTHGEYEVTYAGDSDFGIESHINYNDLKLSWFDHYLKDNQLPATYNKKCTYEVISKAYALPIETIRRHCKIWLDTGIMKKSKERGLYTDFDVVFNSNLFRQTHFTIANKMIKAWEKLINNMNELDFIENKISFKPRSIDNIKQIEKLDYIKIIFNLNYFWYRASNYLKLSPLTFTELSVLSSAFYFKEEDKILYAHKNTDYYDNNILIPTNINSIANATLIPRETARRCVHSLIEKQILKKSSNLIFVSEKLLEGKIEVNKNVKKEIIRDSLIVLKTFDQALN